MFFKYLGGERGNKSPQELFQSYQLAFQFYNHACAIIFVDDIDDRLWDQSYSDENELIEYAIENIFDEIVGHDYESRFIHRSDNIVFCIIGTRHEDGDRIKKDLKKAFIETVGLTKKMGIDCSVYISDIFRDLSDVKEEYKKINSIYALSYSEDERVVLYEEVTEIVNDLEILPSLKERLKEAIKNRDKESALKLVERIFSEYGSFTKAYQFVYMKHEIMDIFMSVIKELDPAAMERYMNAIVETNHIDKMYLLKNSVVQLILRLCSESPVEKEIDSNTQLVINIQEYVEENYFNVDLNINALGEHFGLSPSYLSSIFKMQRGEMLRDYIADVRLRNAQVLLLANERVAVIAEKCGFADAGSFRRTFKRYFGITPSEYRKGESVGM